MSFYYILGLYVFGPMQLGTERSVQILYCTQKIEQNEITFYLQQTMSYRMKYKISY